jgi:protocatechuate 3,4-dioxygenase alpha subunit
MPKQTPSQTVGPFFKDGMLPVQQNVLVEADAQGQRLRLVGRVFDGAGEPVPDAVVEIWQADGLGRFNHPAGQESSGAPADPHFRGFGRSGTAGEGEFWFETVRPGRVPGPDGTLQAPHIDVLVFARGLLMHLLTRVYFEDEAANQSDPVLAAIADPARRRTLLAARAAEGAIPTYRFDIHLQGERETVFFEP